MSSAKRQSFVWSHFSDLKGEGKRAQCHICEKIVAYHSGSRSNLYRHLKSVHGTHLVDGPTEEVIEHELPDLDLEVPSIHEKETDEAVDNLVTQDVKPLLKKSPQKVVRPRMLARRRPALGVAAKKRKLIMVSYAKPGGTKDGGENTVRAYLPNVFSDDCNNFVVHGNSKRANSKVFVRCNDDDDSASFENTTQNEVTSMETPHHLKSSPVELPELPNRLENTDSWLEAIKYKTDAKIQIAKEKLRVKKEIYFKKHSLADQKEKNRHEEKMLELKLLEIKHIQGKAATVQENI